MLKPGTRAPDFEAPQHDGSAFCLSEWLGRRNVALYFYLKDFTHG